MKERKKKTRFLLLGPSCVFSFVVLIASLIAAFEFPSRFSVKSHNQKKKDFIPKHRTKVLYWMVGYSLFLLGEIS